MSDAAYHSRVVCYPLFRFQIRTSGLALDMRFRDVCRNSRCSDIAISCEKQALRKIRLELADLIDHHVSPSSSS